MVKVIKPGIFRGLSTWELSSITFDDEQSDLLYSAATHGNPSKPHLTQGKSEEKILQNAAELAGKAETRKEGIPDSRLNSDLFWA